MYPHLKQTYIRNEYETGEPICTILNKRELVINSYDTQRGCL